MVPKVFFLQQPGLCWIEIEGCGDKFTDASVNLVKQIAMRRIEGVIQVEDPSVGIAPVWRGMCLFCRCRLDLVGGHRAIFGRGSVFPNRAR